MFIHAQYIVTKQQYKTPQLYLMDFVVFTRIFEHSIFIHTVPQIFTYAYKENYLRMAGNEKGYSTITTTSVVVILLYYGIINQKIAYDI